MASGRSNGVPKRGTSCEMQPRMRESGKAAAQRGLRRKPGPEAL